jgi:hypothetical protein
MIRSTLALALTAVLLAACGDGATDQQAEAPAALEPAGAPETVEIDEAAWLQAAASVVELAALPDLNAKVFGTAAGDPAVNGLYTFIAFFDGPAEGWRVFRLGDFESFTVLASAPGRIDLEISESAINAESGQVASTTRRVIVGWTPGEDGAAPQTISVTPAA